MKKKVIAAIAGIIAVFGVVIMRGERITPDGYNNANSATDSVIVMMPGQSAIPNTKEPVQNETAEPKQTASGETKKPGTTAKPAETKGPVAYEKIHSKAKVKDYGNGVVSVGDSAYEQYSYMELSAKRYTSLVNKLAKKLKGKAAVYDMVVPTSIGVTLPDNKKDKVHSSYQDEAIANMYQNLSGNVAALPVYEKLMEHRTEYVFFRTDHHWTMLGAYYAYVTFCQEKGIEAHALKEYTKKSFGGYLGTFYTDTNKNPALKKDKMWVYYPVCHEKMGMKYTDQSGRKLTGKVIEDGSAYGTGLKYVSLIDGDNPFSVITNKSVKDNSSIVVVKESFGNALVPYLADHYRKVYVIDYRYWEGNVAKFVKEKKSSEVLFVNNISMTRNSYLLGRMALVIEE